LAKIRSRRSCSARWPTQPTSHVCRYVAPQYTNALTTNAITTRFSVPTSPCLIPSSIANFASGAGASAAAVASTSETSIQITRARYGRSSARTRRNLRPRPPVSR